MRVSNLICALLMVSAWSCGSDSSTGECSGSGCVPDQDVLVPDGGTIDGIQAASVLVPGSRVRVRGAGLDTYSSESRLVLVGQGVSFEWNGAQGSDLLFVVSESDVALLTPQWTGSVYVVEGARTSSSFAVSFTFSSTVPLVFEKLVVDQGVHFNDLLLICGEGIPAPGEGEAFLVFQGTFVPDSGESFPVDGELPVVSVDEFSRDRGQVLFSTVLTGLDTGQFSGVVKLRTTDLALETHTTFPVALVFEVLGPEVYSVTPDTARLGQIMEISGAGFLSAELASEAGSSESTVFEIQGLFTEEASGQESKVEAILVPAVVSGEQATFVLESEVGEDRLVSSLFGKGSGQFQGTLRAVVGSGANRTLTSLEAPVEFQVLTTGQVVHLTFLPGFDESLNRFGLIALEPEIKASVKDKIERLYALYHLDVRLEQPTDIDPNHYATVEIGGPDPNGIGLLGFDNTPGKDVGNLRLFDAIGGTNAQTQADGYPGYGGVFIEAFLYFSSHPDLPGTKPTTAPEPLKEFDDIFDPVRLKAGMWTEYQGQGDFQRVKDVRLAVDTLARLVGETTAHEIGHSLGLANPYGPANSYHNAVDEPGCLMDAGSDRPFSERAELPGAAPTTFCHDHPEYLMEILGPR